MAFSGKVSSSPIKRLPALPPSTLLLLLLLLLDSLSYISICISFASHLRTIHSSQLTSTIFPIPRRDNWSKLEKWDLCLHGRYEIRLLQLAFLRVLNLPACGNKTWSWRICRVLKKMSLTSHEMFNWVLKFYFSFKEGKSALKVVKNSTCL